MTESTLTEDLRLRLASYPKETLPLEHATLQFNLGLALIESPEGVDEIDQRAAINAFAQALTVFRPATYPIERARVLNALGSVERDLGSLGVSQDRFVEARDLLEPTRSPAEYGAVMNNLGLVYADRALRSEMISAFEEALVAFSSDAYPRQRMATLHNLGQALANAGGETDRVRALEVYREALTLVGDQDTLYLEALVHTSLGLALMAMTEESAFDESIAEYHQALSVFDRLTYPFQHAVTINNLGVAYLERSESNVNDARMALVLFESALRLFDPRIHVALWEEARSNLARAEDRLERLGFASSRAHHFAQLMAEVDPTEMRPLLRNRIQSDLGLPEPHRTSRLSEFDAAILDLSEEQAKAVSIMWLEVLIEQPVEQLTTGLKARMAVHKDLEDVARESAARVLEHAVGHLEILQRVGVRDYLVELGYDRPDGI